ncbi:30531_t:CDS:2 [Gigaspora margarita]|uniref:30531_t:CDS:1 n=1 Tax=Gigaspora margarita TaxID=4874 RepID=A0ABN7UFQ2_GIGMA|nr:30531_t:CDS:2 [Gigaspora margarita]
MHAIRLAVEAIKANIPCKNINCNHPYEYIALPNNKVFKCIQPYAIKLKPFAIMDKHRLMKAALKPIIHATILCYIKISCSSPTKNCGQLIFNAGLVTYWNSCTIEHQNGQYKPQPDVKHCVNQEKLNELPKTRHATASSLTINSIKPYKFDDIHNIGEDQLIIENEHLHSMMHLLNKDIDSFILNNNQTNLNDLSNSHISTCDYQNLEILNANISESRFTQPKLNNLNSHIEDNENTSLSQRRRIENSALEELFKEQNIS